MMPKRFKGFCLSTGNMFITKDVLEISSEQNSIWRKLVVERLGKKTKKHLKAKINLNLDGKCENKFLL